MTILFGAAFGAVLALSLRALYYNRRMARELTRILTETNEMIRRYRS